MSMSEVYRERIFPSPEEEPRFSINIDGQEYIWGWDNTTIMRYRIEYMPDFDESLGQYDHVYHEFTDHNNEVQALFVLLEHLPKGAMDMLENHSFPQLTSPKPPLYILEAIAKKHPNIIPDSLGPDFDKAA